MKSKVIGSLTLSGFLLLFIVSACAGRLPKPNRVQELAAHHFNRYAKKYKDSFFGGSKVKEVDILGIEEIHKNLVGVWAFITMENGTVRKVRLVLERSPFGWKYKSWEDEAGSS